MDIGKILILVGFLLMPCISASQAGLNHFDTFSNYLNISSPNQTYSLEFVVDDWGQFASKFGVADLDNDGTNELIIPNYNGYLQIANWSGLTKGLYEVQGSDLGTIYLYTGMMDRGIGPGVDNDGDGYLEIAVNYYSNARTTIFEYDGTTLSTFWRDTTDRGTYRTSPEYCDIDGDGDYDIMACTYEGVCRLWIYDSGTYNLNFTDSDRGTRHYSNHPKCVDLDNDGDKDFVVTRYEGYVDIYNWSSNALSWVGQLGDYGTYYSPPMTGDFLGDGNNYLMACDTGFACEIFNCTGDLSSCSLMDTSNDLGSCYYGGCEGRILNKDGKDKVLITDSEGDILIGEMEDATTFTWSSLGIDSYSETYAPVEIANVSNGYDFVFGSTRYDEQIKGLKYDSGDVWNLDKITNLKYKYFGRNYLYGFTYGGGMSCGQLDHSTPEDECIIPNYVGGFYVFTYQNVSEYHSDYVVDPRLTFLDLMPTDALQYVPKGENRTYCLNEDRNMLYGALGQKGIDSWANAYDDEGSTISNAYRITDGIVSTHALKGTYQNSVDYTNFDSGANQYVEINLSVPVQIGQLKINTYHQYNHDPYDLKVQISNTSCSSPSWKTVFNESNGDISGTMPYSGIKIRFVPQDVQCIRITASGEYYYANAYSSSNRITEVEGHYANDCTFYAISPEDLGGQIGEDYNLSMDFYSHDRESSGNYWDQDIQLPVKSSLSFMHEIIARVITIVKQW